jgi:nucleoside-diphosphate-sugar epimerase
MTPIIDIAEKIIQNLDGKNSIILKENRTGEVVRSSIDISKAQTHLGYSPHIKIDDGIKKTIEWYKSHLNIK